MSNKVYVYVCSYEQGSKQFPAEFIFQNEKDAKTWCYNWNKDIYASRYLKAVYKKMELY